MATLPKFLFLSTISKFFSIPTWVPLLFLPPFFLSCITQGSARSWQKQTLLGGQVERVNLVRMPELSFRGEGDAGDPHTLRTLTHHWCDDAARILA